MTGDRRMAQMLCVLAFLALIAIPASCAARGGDDGSVDAPLDGWGRASQRFLEAAPRGSDASRFLDDLALDAGERDSAVAWTSDAGLVGAAREVLEAYRGDGSARLLTSGYLDLHGNVWGALVMMGSRDVDMVVASSDAEDATTRVRVARLGGGS